MNQANRIVSKIDWLTIILYAILVIFGWINIYSSVYNEEHRNIFGLSKKPVCNLSVVFLKKIFSGLTGKKVEVTEISCMGQGKNKCIFDIKLIWL